MLAMDNADSRHVRFPFRLYPKCLPQILPALGMFFILTSSAIPYGWIICQKKFPYDVHLYMAWFIGAIIGGLASGLFARIVRKLIFCWASGALALSGGLLLILSDETQPIIKSPYLSGVGFGLLFIPGIIYAGEIADVRIRGMLCGLVGLGQSFAALISALNYLVSQNRGSSFELTLGGIAMILAVIGLFLCGRVVESPVYLIMKGREDAALSSLTHFRRHYLEADEIHAEMRDIMGMVTEATLERNSFFSADTFKPLLKTLLMRWICVFSMTVHMVRIISIWIKHRMLHADYIPFWIMGSIRTGSSIFNIFLVDVLGNKFTLISSLLFSGMAITSFVSLEFSDDFTVPVRIPFALLMVYGFMVGAGLEATTSTYLSVAFSPWTKGFYICLIFTLEMLMYILTMYVHSSQHYFDGQLFTLGIIAIIAGAAYIFLLPEINKLGLRSCYKMMRNTNNF